MLLIVFLIFDASFHLLLEKKSYCKVPFRRFKWHLIKVDILITFTRDISWFIFWLWLTWYFTGHHGAVCATEGVLFRWSQSGRVWCCPYCLGCMGWFLLGPWCIRGSIMGRYLCKYLQMTENYWIIPSDISDSMICTKTFTFYHIFMHNQQCSKCICGTLEPLKLTLLLVNVHDRFVVFDKNWTAAVKVIYDVYMACIWACEKCV